MTASPNTGNRQCNWWTRFWHEPIRAEQAAGVRIFFMITLITDLLVEYIPHLELFYGPDGVAPEGVVDYSNATLWRWTGFLFRTDNMIAIYIFFGVFLTACVLFLIGWKTRWMGVLVYLLTLAFQTRNFMFLNYGDDVLMCALFLLMFTPSGKALSLDRWLEKRRHPDRVDNPPMIAPWSIRLFQLQLCLIYFTTGFAKLQGEEFFSTTWTEGSTIYYVLNNLRRTRFSYALVPVPYWITVAMTWSSLAFEVLFPLLVLFRWTRFWTLWFGVLFHLGIFVFMDIGFFSIYMIALYGAWIPGKYWDWLLRNKWETEYS